MGNAQINDLSLSIQIPGLISLTSTEDKENLGAAPLLNLKFNNPEMAMAFHNRIKNENNEYYELLPQHNEQINLSPKPIAKTAKTFLNTEYHSLYCICRELIKLYGSTQDTLDQLNKAEQNEAIKAKQISDIVNRIPGISSHIVKPYFGTKSLIITFQSHETRDSFSKTWLAETRRSITSSGELSHHAYIEENDIQVRIHPPKSTADKPSKKTFDNIISLLDTLYPEQLTETKTPTLSSTQLTLSALITFLQSEKDRITTIKNSNRYTKGASDKASGFNRLSEISSTTLQAINKNELSPAAAEDTINYLIKETALIAHHKRYSKWNRLANILSFGTWHAESTSWKNWRAADIGQGLFKRIVANTLENKAGRSVRINDKIINDYNSYRKETIHKPR